MSEMDLEDARSALRANNPSALIGVRECRWLDAKREPYEPRNPASVEELAKDVAAFANTEHGGLLVLGISTRAENEEEILEALVPVTRSAVDLDQLRKLIRQRITPAPRGVTVEWIDIGQGTGIAFIDVPVQPPANLPYVVAAPVSKPGQVNPDTAAVPIREADGTHWLPRTEIHRLLAAGLASSGTPTPQALAQIVETAVAQASANSRPAAPRHRVGQGMPAREREFRATYELLRQTAPVGEPTSEVYATGPGIVQHLAPTTSSRDGWVLSALPHQPPVAVAESIWQALIAAGSGTPGGDALSAVGYPFTENPSGAAQLVLGEDTQVLELDAGRWGRGRLVRTADTRWAWEPVPRIGFDQSRAARNWTGDATPPQLRIRALATLPWAAAGSLDITPARRRDLARDVAYSHLAGAATMLSKRRGAELPAATWTAGPHRNALNAASYSSTIRDPDGRAALTAEVMVALPNSTDSSVVACAELRLEDKSAWESALAFASGSRQDTLLSLEEVQDVFLAAWRTATELLPTAVTNDPAVLRWAQAPTVDLRLSAEHRHDEPSAWLTLHHLIDFTPFGASDRESVSEMSVTVTAAPAMPEVDRRRLLRQAMVLMGQGFGYVEAEEDRL